MAVSTRENTELWSAEDSLEELAQLATTAGATVVGRIIQKLPIPSKTHYIGEGKVSELLALKSSTNYNVVIFDDELSPLQQRNLEEVLKAKVIDRVMLILDIFARRARTREGQLQVELAQYQYLYPRLTGKYRQLGRLGAGIGTRGPGETKLENDRRVIRERIHRLKMEIEKVRDHRQLYRVKRQRSGIPIVALVGYTNAGKSSLLNALSRSGVRTEQTLFTTLDPTTRRVVLPDKRTILLSDTVGFIKKLPPTIITAFRATLEELTDANILVHVVDLPSRNAVEQCQAVEKILAELGLEDKPRITALNKIDLLLSPDKTWTEEEAVTYLVSQPVPELQNTVLVSATRKWGLQRLLEVIGKVLEDTTFPVPVFKSDAL